MTINISTLLLGGLVADLVPAIVETADALARVIVFCKLDIIGEKTDTAS